MESLLSLQRKSYLFHALYFSHYFDNPSLQLCLKDHFVCKLLKTVVFKIQISALVSVWGWMFNEFLLKKGRKWFNEINLALSTAPVAETAQHEQKYSFFGVKLPVMPLLTSSTRFLQKVSWFFCDQFIRIWNKVYFSWNSSEVSKWYYEFRLSFFRWKINLRRFYFNWVNLNSALVYMTFQRYIYLTDVLSSDDVREDELNDLGRSTLIPYP